MLGAQVLFLVTLIWPDFKCIKHIGHARKFSTRKNGTEARQDPPTRGENPFKAFQDRVPKNVAHSGEQQDIENGTSNSTSPVWWNLVLNLSTKNPKCKNMRKGKLDYFSPRIRVKITNMWKKNIRGDALFVTPGVSCSFWIKKDISDEIFQISGIPRSSKSCFSLKT